ncbi:MAG: ABC transporter permease, partial [Acidobacteriota bacterium]|nr:ABC transporter permease [Acidobacteriota bacterium]
GVQYVAAGANTRGQVIAGNQNWSTNTEGTDVDMPLIRSWQSKYGSFFSPQDVSGAAKVAVLGSLVADTLFGPDVDPTGQMIRIRNQPFRVVGVMSSKGQSGTGQDQDDIVFVPYTTVIKKLQGQQHIQRIQVSAETPDVAPVAAAISEVLRTRHKLMPGDPDDFMVRTLEEMAAVRSETARTMGTLLAAIAGVSLLVGGIGIMNIMLVSVTERTREIGLRMAIGARGKDVLLQFLVEAVVLSLFGGIIGIAFGFALAEAAERFLEWPTTIPANAIAMAFGFAAATGVFFGFYPARKAARLDPIEALRFE